MAYLGNSPAQLTVLRLEVRKSFTLGVHVRDPRGRPVDLTGCSLRIVAKVPGSSLTDDSDNLLLADEDAVLVNAARGYARFDIQAATLDHAPREYPFAIVLVTADGYSSVLVKGVLDLQDNTEFASTGSMFSDLDPVQTLDVVLRERNVLVVRVGGQLPPGMNYVRDDVLAALEAFDPESVAYVPAGGAAGTVLTKITGSDYAMAWRPVGNGAGGLDATGAPNGYVPTSQGDDTWDWAPSVLDASELPAGQVPTSDGSGNWSWADVEHPSPDWEAEEEEPGFILNKPTLGTAAAADASDFYASDTLVLDMQGIHVVTELPASLEEGHLYILVEE